MLSFKGWCEEQAVQKPWKAKKEEILKFWQALPPSMPIQPTNVVPVYHQGSTYPYDGIRVTGSQQFINSVASRLKDMLNFEGQDKKLYLLYKQQVDKKTQFPLPNSFVFYVQARQRDQDGVTPNEL